MYFMPWAWIFQGRGEHLFAEVETLFLAWKDSGMNATGPRRDL
jgi:hypothetical protein